MMSDGIAGVLLAAGDSSRFESGNKLLMRLAGQPVIYHTLQALLESRLTSVFIITGFERERVIKALSGLVKNPRLNIVNNSFWPNGKASSVRVALEALPPAVSGALFLPGDMPLMTTTLVNHVVERFCETGRVTFPVINNMKGHPVIFPRQLWPELEALQGEASAMEIVRKHWGVAEKISLPVEDEASQLDVDTLEDLRKIERLVLSKNRKGIVS